MLTKSICPRVEEGASKMVTPLKGVHMWPSFLGDTPDSTEVRPSCCMTDWSWQESSSKHCCLLLFSHTHSTSTLSTTEPTAIAHAALSVETEALKAAVCACV